MEKKDMYAVWSWGDRKVSWGKVLDKNERIVIMEVTLHGETNNLVIPRGSFKFKFFDTEEAAKEFMEKDVH